MRETQERPLYMTEKIKNFAYNAKYNALKYFEEYDKTSFLRPGDKLYILGRTFLTTPANLTQVQDEIYTIFMSTPWITYRAGFPELPNELVGSYVSDTGWGCMVRVGQMLFAQVIKHHKRINDKQEMANILNLFSDFDKGQPFSIQKIACRARVEYGLKPGDWYNPSQIAFILAQLHEQYLASEIGLKVKVFNSGNLFFDSLAENMFERKIVCKCLEKPTGFVCQKCNQPKNSVAVVILSRLGLNGPEQKYLSILDKLIEFQSFQGIIGGKPEKALYFVGKHNDQYIYLDPHYVQTAEKDPLKQHDSYFCESFRKCKNTSIDSSLGICFYLRDTAALNRFHVEINELKNSNVEDFFIFVADQTPSYARQKGKIYTSKAEEGQDDIFEML